MYGSGQPYVFYLNAAPPTRLTPNTHTQTPHTHTHASTHTYTHTHKHTCTHIHKHRYLNDPDAVPAFVARHLEAPTVIASLLPPSDTAPRTSSRQHSGGCGCGCACVWWWGCQCGCGCGCGWVGGWVWV